MKQYRRQKEIRLTSTQCSRRRITQRALLLPPCRHLSALSVRSRQGLADPCKVRRRQVLREILAQSTTAGVVGEADESAVLVGVQGGGVGHGANAAFVGADISLQKGLALCLGYGGRDVTAADLHTVGAVTCAGDDLAGKNSGGGKKIG